MHVDEINDFNPPEHKDDSDLIGEIANTKSQLNETEVKAIRYRCMAKTYWERWRFELDERKKLLIQERELRFQMRYTHFSPKTLIPCYSSIPSIDRSMLQNPTGYDSVDKDDTLFFARGSFGVIKLQQYRGMNVAVKEFLPHTCASSVRNEASVLLRLNHPYVPLLFGMCVSKEPFIIVLQYHGVDGKSITLHKELLQKKVLSPGSYHTWMVLCSELAEPIRYLHEDAHIIHNDLNGDNIVLSNSFTHRPIHADVKIQIVVVDFGKATEKNSGRMYELSCHDRELYKVRFRHIAPEVIDGLMKQSVKSDMFALGKLFQRIINDSKRLQGLDRHQMEKVCDISRKCTSTRPSDRPTAHSVFNTFESILKGLK